jgi:hypothetical protein
MSDIIGDKENSSPARISALSQEAAMGSASPLRISALSQEAAMGSASPLVEEIRACNTKTVTMLSREGTHSLT